MLRWLQRYFQRPSDVTISEYHRKVYGMPAIPRQLEILIWSMDLSAAVKITGAAVTRHNRPFTLTTNTHSGSRLDEPTKVERFYFPVWVFQSDLSPDRRKNLKVELCRPFFSLITSQRGYSSQSWSCSELSVFAQFSH